MEAGKLNRPILIKKPQDTKDNLGGQTRTWVDQAYMRAAIEPMTGKEILYGDQRQSAIGVKITVRYHLPLPEAAWRVYDLNGNDVYDINAVSDIKSQHKMLELTCTKLGSEQL